LQNKLEKKYYAVFSRKTKPRLCFMIKLADVNKFIANHTGTFVDNTQKRTKKVIL